MHDRHCSQRVSPLIVLLLLSAASLPWAGLAQSQNTRAGEGSYRVVRNGQVIFEHAQRGTALSAAIAASAIDGGAVRIEGPVSWTVHVVELEAFKPSPESDEPRQAHAAAADALDVQARPPGKRPVSLTRPAQGPDNHAYYVAAAGSDANDGRDPQRPLASLDAAYRKVRSGSGDAILIKAGDSFDKGFSWWGKSGRSADEPLFVGVYGDGARPVIHDTLVSSHGDTTVRHVVFQGLHAYARQRDPGHRAFALSTRPARKEKDGEMVETLQGVGPWRKNGVRWLAPSHDIRFEDLKIEYFSFGMVLQGSGGGEAGEARTMSDISVYRCIIRDSFGHANGDVAGHSSAIYAAGIEGLAIVQCLFDRNGFNTRVDGAQPTWFNHNLYLQGTNSNDVEVRGCLITRGALHGVMARSGGRILNNTMVRNPIGAFVSTGDDPPAQPTHAIADNVVAQGCDLGDKSHGRGLQVHENCAGHARVTGNIVMNKRGSAHWMAAYEIAAPRRDPQRTVLLEGNIASDWPSDDGAFVIHPQARAKTTARDNRRIENLPGVADYARSLGHADFWSLIDAAAHRPRDTWPTQLSAAAINDWVRAQARER